MSKESISARVESIVVTEAKKVAKKRDISFSRLVEVALINEINKRGFDNGLLSELIDIRDYVDEKIGDLSVISESDVQLEVHDQEYYVDKLVDFHQEHNRLTTEIVEDYSRRAGVSFKEMICLLNEKGNFNFV